MAEIMRYSSQVTPLHSFTKCTFHGTMCHMSHTPITPRHSSFQCWQQPVLSGTLALSCSLANSPLHRMQRSAVTSRKQSPLFSDRTEGSTRRTWTCRLPVTTGTGGKYTNQNAKTTSRKTQRSSVFDDLWCEWASVCWREDKTLQSQHLRRRWRRLDRWDVTQMSSLTLWGKW